MKSLGSVKGKVLRLIYIFPLRTECCNNSTLCVGYSFVEMARIIKFFITNWMKMAIVIIIRVVELQKHKVYQMAIK